MSHRLALGFLAIAAIIASSAPSFAGGGAIGCNNLPEYERAVGTIENGEYSCGLSMAEARRIIAEHDRGGPQR